MLIQRKQLIKVPETNIDYISAVPQWFKFEFDHTHAQISGSGQTAAITLCTLPIKSWIHGWGFKATGWTATGGTGDIRFDLGDEDDDDKWVDNIQLFDGDAATNEEDYVGHTPVMFDPDNDHDLIATIRTPGFGPELGDIDAGSMEIWFKLSSMNEGSAG